MEVIHLQIFIDLYYQFFIDIIHFYVEPDAEDVNFDENLMEKATHINSI